MPLGIDWTSIPVRGASAFQQQAEQVSLCWRASARMDQICNQVLRATVDTEQLRGPDFRLTVDNSTGEGRFIVSRWPIIQILTVQVAQSAIYPPNWNTVPPGNYHLEFEPFGELNSYLAGSAAAGPAALMLAPGTIDWFQGRNAYFVQVGYINGWPNSGIQGEVTADATQVNVDDITGWVSPTGGSTGWIYDGGNTEAIQVFAAQPDTVGAVSGPGTLTLAQPVEFAHAPGIRVSAMPPTLQWAAGLLAAGMALTRGSTAVVAQSLRSRAVNQGSDAQAFLAEAKDILQPYARIW